jgi:hypothetical protein
MPPRQLSVDTARIEDLQSLLHNKKIIPSASCGVTTSKGKIGKAVARETGCLKLCHQSSETSRQLLEWIDSVNLGVIKKSNTRHDNETDHEFDVMCSTRPFVKK